jgi:ABC-type branched-subunit amino acid transport system ATPase component
MATDPDFAGLGREAETMSSGEALLVGIARDLWTAERTIGLVDVVRRLDPHAFERVVQALKIARGQMTRGVLAAETVGEIAA